MVVVREAWVEGGQKKEVQRIGGHVAGSRQAWAAQVGLRHGGGEGEGGKEEGGGQKGEDGEARGRGRRVRS